MNGRPADITLPEGWDWDRVEAARATWGISDDMVPLATVAPACTAWGTIASVRMLRVPHDYRNRVAVP